MHAHANVQHTHICIQLKRDDIAKLDMLLDKLECSKAPDAAPGVDTACDADGSDGEWSCPMPSWVFEQPQDVNGHLRGKEP